MNVVMIIVMVLLGDSGGVQQAKAYAVGPHTSLESCQERADNYNRSAKLFKEENAKSKNLITYAYCEGEV